MRYIKLLLASIILITLPVVLACFNSDRSNHGVTWVSEPAAIENSPNPSDKSNSEVGKSVPSTNEDIATLFTACMRDNGFVVRDPELNADGSINWEPLKGDLSEYSMGDKNNSKYQGSLDECLPLLEGITDSKEVPKEDIVEIQDRTLEFAKCLRNNGLDAPDPYFGDSDNPRTALKPLLATLTGSSARIDKIVTICSQTAFGTDSIGKKSGGKGKD